MRVPFVRHDYQRDEWVAVCRILVKGYLTNSYQSYYCLGRSLPVSVLASAILT